jgi:hypothetical protein
MPTRTDDGKFNGNISRRWLIYEKE